MDMCLYGSLGLSSDQFSRMYRENSNILRKRMISASHTIRSELVINLNIINSWVDLGIKKAKKGNLV